MSREHEPAGSEDVPLPEGWKMRVDKRTNKKFYINTVTRERFWQRPLNNDEPRDFYRKFDRKSGRIYYVHFATKKTCWKLPPRAIVKDIRDLKLAASAEKKRRSPNRRVAEVDPEKAEHDEFTSLVRKARQQADSAIANGNNDNNNNNVQVSPRQAAKQRLPESTSSPTSRNNVPTAVHISRNGSVHISSPAAVKYAQEHQDQEDFPEPSGSPEPAVHSTDHYRRRMQQVRDEADQEAQAGSESAVTPSSQPLHPVDEANPADEFRPAKESAAYHGGTQAKSGTSTLSAHGPDPNLASLHHDTESLDQDNKILRAQCLDLRSELSDFKSGLNDSLSDVAALLETLSGIESRHGSAAATSPRRLRYGRDPGQQPMAIENGPANGNSEPQHGSPSVHISRRGSVTISTR